MTNERGTVISRIISNSNRSDDDEDDRENESKRVGVGDNAILTPTYFHFQTTPNTSFAFLINPTICHLRDYISDYATCVSVDIFLPSSLYNVLN